MKFMHLGDLHIGKKVNEFSMIEDQKYIIEKILEVVDAEKVDGVILAGDIYDKGLPPVEAVQLFDDFLNSLALRKLKVFIISGNHDSAERISFGARLMENSGIYFSHVYDGNIKPIELEDENGKLNVYLLPFLKPHNVKSFYPEAEIESYTDACRVAVEKMNVDYSQRNVLVAHQFVTGAERCESEELSIGGLDNVDVSAFKDFDYVALGHIHGPQKIIKETIRYSGTPLKYSFSECNHKKSACIIEFGAKEDVKINLVPLKPIRDMREIRGTFEEVTSKEFYEKQSCSDYLRFILTDEDETPDATAKLRVIYPNVMKVNYDNTRTRTNGTIEKIEAVEKISPLEIFGKLYEKQNNQPMSEEQKKFIAKLIEEIWGGVE